MKGLATTILLTSALLGCESTVTEECDCLPAGLTITTGPNLTVTALKLHGACATAQTWCAGQPAPSNNVCAPADLFILPEYEGTCRIEVIAPGRETELYDVEFERFDGCCAGIYARGDWLLELQ